MAYEAWSNIWVGKIGDDDKVTTSTLKPGDPVTPADVACESEDDPQFQEYLASGAIRVYQFPDLPEGYSNSPVQFLKDQVRAVEDSVLSLEGGLNLALMQQDMTGAMEVPTEAPPVTEDNTTPPANGGDVQL